VVCAVDIKRLAGVNARLSRARDEYRDALTAEHKTEELSTRFPSEGVDARKVVQSARARTKRAAEQYQEALDEFIKFNVKRSA
jgi:hypothetical protein